MPNTKRNAIDQDWKEEGKLSHKCLLMARKGTDAGTFWHEDKRAASEVKELELKISALGVPVLRPGLHQNQLGKLLKIQIPSLDPALPTQNFLGERA